KTIWNSMAENHIMGIATARTYKKSEQFLRGLHINTPMILLDGSLIVSPEKKIMDMKVLSQEMGYEIIQCGAKIGIYPFVLALKDQSLNEAFLYPSKTNKHQKELILRYKGDDNLQECSNIKAMENNFKLVYFGEKNQLEELQDNLQSIFKDEIKYILAPEAYLGCYFLTLLHKDADKAHGLQKVHEITQIDYKDFTVFGDNLNDIGMFKLAQHSVAVSNAHKEVKELASFVSEYSNNEDAVAKYLQSIH
ncbi:HAD family hydrolase, partial [Arcobacteraceae bacterium]|nr:HAD family hydrolase [Arcobacteraceae bacterium]